MECIFLLFLFLVVKWNVNYHKVTCTTHLNESSVSLLTVAFLSCAAENHSNHNARFSASEPWNKK